MQQHVLENARALCEKFILWQAPSGGINIETCAYHRPPLMRKNYVWQQDLPWLARSLYAMFDHTGDLQYKAAADRFAIYFIVCLNPKSPAFALGGGLEPCYKLYSEHNPLDDILQDKARFLYQWMLGYRTENGNYIDCGYNFPADSGLDAGFSCDLTDVGRGLIAFYQLFKQDEALDHAVGLAQYFLNDANPGTYDGLWSDEIGTWLVGPTDGAGFENLKVPANSAGWGWSTYYASHWLLRLHDEVQDEALKDRIKSRSVRSLQWMFDACQFDDGALGMAERDDKWVGMTALVVLQYLELHARNMLNADFHQTYYPKVIKSLEWLEFITDPVRFPDDGFIPVTATTHPIPGCNTVWLHALTVESLLAGPRLRSLGDV